ncbi:MAG: hypothetical protein QM803_16005 [Rhodocyclaceae bacterium]
MPLPALPGAHLRAIHTANMPPKGVSSNGQATPCARIVWNRLAANSVILVNATTHRPATIAANQTTMRSRQARQSDRRLASALARRDGRSLIA